MKQFKQKFVDSWHELKKTKVLAVTAMLIAIGVILDFCFSLQLTESIKIGFSGIPNELTSMMFGPVVGGIMGGIGDILKFLIKPTGAYFFGFTLNAILGPVIYGIFLYQRPVKFGRILAAKITVSLLVNLLLGHLVADDPVWFRIYRHSSGKTDQAGSFCTDRFRNLLFDRKSIGEVKGDIHAHEIKKSLLAPL